MEAVVEQRKHSRNVISWPISMWIPEASRFFNGKSANISKSGVYMRVPMTTPIRAGNLVEINFPRTIPLATEKGQFARIKTGKVVRVDRKQMLQDAQIGIAVAFEN